jgi:hypothetical protein
MKDAFLIFLMALAATLIAVYLTVAAFVLKSDGESEEDESEAGCALGIAGLFVAAIVASILYTVGTNVGVHMPSDWK